VNFLGEGYYISMVGKHGDETTLSSYVRKLSNDKNYKVFYQQQLKLWDRYLFFRTSQFAVESFICEIVRPPEPCLESSFKGDYRGFMNPELRSAMT
jgi:hypothetical protein